MVRQGAEQQRAWAMAWHRWWSMPQAISQPLARAVVARWLPLWLLANTTRASPLTVIPGDAHKATRGPRRQLGRGTALLGQASRVSFGTCGCPVDHPCHFYVRPVLLPPRLTPLGWSGDAARVDLRCHRVLSRQGAQPGGATATHI
jgi:hypothetical protein